MPIYNEIHHHTRKNIFHHLAEKKIVVIYLQYKQVTCDLNQWFLPLVLTGLQSFPGIRREGHLFQSPQNGYWPRIIPPESPRERGNVNISPVLLKSKLSKEQQPTKWKVILGLILVTDTYFISVTWCLKPIL